MDEMPLNHQDVVNLDKQLAPFAQLTGDEFPFLMPVPIVGDTLAATARKLSDLASVIRSGRSFMLTNNKTLPSKHDPEAFARECMLATELAHYEEWKSQAARLPALDWAKNVLPVHPRAFKTFSQRATAMDIIWRRQGATPENAAWLSVFHLDLLPLVKAVVKVLSAKVYLADHNPLSHLSASEIAEVNALQLINAVVDENMALESESRRKLMESIHESQAVLKERLNLLAKK